MRLSQYFLCAMALLGLALALGCGGECNTSKRYLVVKTFAGTSNRLRTLASAKIMAAVTDRELLVDWPILKDEMPATFNDLFLNPILSVEQSPLPAQGCTLKYIQNAADGDAMVKNLGSLNNADGQARISKITEDKEAIVYFATSLNFQPDEKFITSSDYSERYNLYYKNLDPVAYVGQTVKKFHKEHDLVNKFMVGVHYRAWNMGKTDSYVINDNANKYLDDFVAEMKKAAAEPMTQTDNKEVYFFLATDDPGVKAKMLAVPELKGKIYAYDADIERSTIKGQQNALVDFYLLGSTNYIIGTYQSSFSDEAAHLTVQNRKVNIGEAVFK